MTARDLALLPKAHLHLHFTGSMRVSTLAELAATHGIRLPSALLDDDALHVPADERGWFRFQRLYDAARACVRSEADMRRIVAEAAQDDASEGSGRLEIQVDPTSYAPFVGGLTPALEIVLDAAREAAASTGVDVGVIVAASRMRHPLEARTLARLAAHHAGDGPGQVVGFGLSNDERRGETSEFAHAFAIARDAGLASVPHGGELLGPAHVEDVVEHLHPDRLGHGVRSAEDPRVLERVVDEGVALEVCPASNVSLGVYDRRVGRPAARAGRRRRDRGARRRRPAAVPVAAGRPVRAGARGARVLRRRARGAGAVVDPGEPRGRRRAGAAAGRRGRVARVLTRPRHGRAIVSID